MMKAFILIFSFLVAVPALAAGKLGSPSGAGQEINPTGDLTKRSASAAVQANQGPTMAEMELRVKELESKAKINESFMGILEKTNSQLGMWTNPYGVAVGAMAVLFAALAIGVAVVLYRQSREFKDLVRDELTSRRKQMEDLISEFRASLRDAQEQYDKAIGDAELQLKGATNNKQELEKAIIQLKADRANMTAAFGATGSAAAIVNSSAPMTFSAFNMSRTTTTCPKCFSTIPLPPGFVPGMRTPYGSGIKCPNCGTIAPI